jgi:hypothetical protein
LCYVCRGILLVSGKRCLAGDDRMAECSITRQDESQGSFKVFEEWQVGHENGIHELAWMLFHEHSLCVVFLLGMVRYKSGLVQQCLAS